MDRFINTSKKENMTLSARTLEKYENVCFLSSITQMFPPKIRSGLFDALKEIVKKY